MVYTHTIKSLTMKDANVPYDSTKKTLGEKIVAYRRLLGISQEKLARLLEIDPSTLGRWERGERQPLKELMERLKEKLNFPKGK